MNMKVVFSDGSELRFRADKNTCIKSIVNACKERNGIEGDVILYDQKTGESCPECENLNQLRIKGGDVLMAEIENIDYKKNDYIDLRVIYKKTEGCYKLNKNVKLSALKSTHCSQFGLNDVALYFGSYQILGTETAEDLGLQNGDFLIAM